MHVFHYHQNLQSIIHYSLLGEVERPLSVCSNITGIIENCENAAHIDYCIDALQTNETQYESESVLMTRNGIGIGFGFAIRAQDICLSVSFYWKLLNKQIICLINRMANTIPWKAKLESRCTWKSPKSGVRFCSGRSRLWTMAVVWHYWHLLCMASVVHVKPIRETPLWIPITGVRDLKLERPSSVQYVQGSLL